MNKARSGWIICEINGKVKLVPGPISVTRKNGKIDGYTGFGELYKLRRVAKEDCDELNEMFSNLNFAIKKATLVWEE